MRQPNYHSTAWAFGLFIGLLVIASAGQASQYSWPGNPWLTYDTDWGLYWLDLNRSAGMSFDYVESQFGPGGQFEGFRHASLSEVASLFLNGGLTPPGNPANDYDEVWQLQTLLSPFVVSGYTSYTWGMTGTYQTGSSYVLVAQLASRSDTQQGYFCADASCAPAYPTNGSGTDPWFYGHWLVSETPEPDTAALVLLGLLALARRGHSRR